MFGDIELEPFVGGLYNDVVIEKSLLKDVVDFSKVDQITTEAGFQPEWNPVGAIQAECGDDLIVVSSCVSELSLQLVVIEDVMGCKISKKDTSITENVGSFAEGLISVPRKYYETWNYAKSTNVDHGFRFIDVPKVRLLVRTSKQRQAFSDTQYGKFADLGKNNRFVWENSREKGLLEIASLMQDAVLSAVTQSESPYAPLVFGGAGKDLPFTTWENHLRFYRTYKDGTYKRFYDQLVKDLVSFADSCWDPNERRQTQWQVCSDFLKDCTKIQPLFRNWEKGQGIFVPLCDLEIAERFRSYKVATVNPKGYERYYANRLIQSGELVTEANLAVGWAHNRTCGLYLRTETIAESREILEREKTSWREAIPKTLDKYKRYLSMDYGFSTSPTQVELAKFWDYNRTHGTLLRKLIHEDVLYQREALDSVYLKGPMMVRSIVAKPNKELYRDPDRPPIVDVEDTETISSIEEILQWFNGPRDTPGPTKVINDDEILIQMAHNLPVDKCPAVVTNDVKLCRAMARKSGRKVLRIPTSVYYSVVYTGMEWEDVLPQQENWEVLLDQGSIDSSVDLQWKDGAFHPKGPTKAVGNINIGWGESVTLELGPEVDLFDSFCEPHLRGWPDDPKYTFDPRARKLSRWTRFAADTGRW